MCSWGKYQDKPIGLHYRARLCITMKDTIEPVLCTGGFPAGRRRMNPAQVQRKNSERKAGLDKDHTAGFIRHKKRSQSFFLKTGTFSSRNERV